MTLPLRVKNKLSSTIWYHATTMEHFHNIVLHGVLVNYNMGRALDFGFGFYLTPKAEMAESYISRLPLGDETRVVLEFNISPLPWFENSTNYTTRVFDSFDEEFAEFVFLNRENAKNEVNAHSYDAIYGGMSDSKPTFLLAQYRLGEISRDEVIQGLKKGTSMKQLSLHNQELCDRLQIRRAYVYDPETEERKELDIHEREHEKILCGKSQG